jgi:RNA polymerase sigma-70 factor (ECF subfamily)
MMKDTKKTEISFAGNGQQVSNDAIIEAVQKATAAYGKYGSHRIPEYDIQDVTQDAFLKAFRSIGSYDPSKASIQTWVSKIVYSCVCDYWNDRAKHEGWDLSRHLDSDFESYPAEDEDGFTGSGYKDAAPYDVCIDSDPEKDLLSKEKMDWLAGHIDRLPAKSQLVIKHELNGLRPRQIAPILGCSSNAVSITSNRARAALKKMAEDERFNAA